MRRLALLLAVLSLGIGPVRTAGAGEDPVAAKSDSVVKVVDPVTASGLELERNLADAMRRRSEGAEVAWAQADKFELLAQAKDAELKLADARIEQAKKAGRDAEVRALEAEKDHLEHDRSLLEAQHELEVARAKLAEARGEVAGAMRAALALDENLGRMQRDVRPGTRELRVLERKVLKAHAESADRTRQMVELEGKAIQKALDVSELLKERMEAGARK